MGIGLFKKAKTEQFRPCLSIPQQNHAYRIIRKHNEASISAMPLTDMEALELEIKYINLILCKICSAFHNIMPPLSLDVSDFIKNSSDKTYYEWCPHTPSGKAAKYPLVLHYHSVFVYNSAGSGESEDDEEYEAWLDYLDKGGNTTAWERRKKSTKRIRHRPSAIEDKEAFGEVYFLESGLIGKARLIFWINGIGHFLYLGQTEGALAIKKIIQCDPPNKTIIYKEPNCRSTT